VVWVGKGTASDWGRDKSGRVRLSLSVPAMLFLLHGYIEVGFIPRT
jgi:hypothetical protein